MNSFVCIDLSYCITTPLDFLCDLTYAILSDGLLNDGLLYPIPKYWLLAFIEPPRGAKLPPRLLLKPDPTSSFDPSF